MPIHTRFLLPVLLIAPAAAIAQEPNLELPPVVVTANRLPLPADHIGSSVSVVTRDDLQKRGISRVYDALKYLPGVTVSRNGGIGGVATVRLRGSSSGQVKVLLDGVTLNDPSNVDGSYDFNDLTVNGIERIEVVRGPQSTLYGTDAMGGVINIITRKGEKRRRTAFIEGGTYDTIETGAALYDRVRTWRYGVEARFFDTEGFSHSSAGDERDGAENSSLHATWGYEASDALSFGATGRYSRIYSGFDPSATIDGPAHLEKEVFLGHVTADWQMNDRWQHNLSLEATDTDRGFDEPLGFFRYSTFDGTTLAAEYQSTVSLAETQTLVAGLRSETQAAQGTSTTGGVTSRDFDADIDNHAVFAEYLVGLGADTSLTLGGRYNNHSIFGGHVTERATLSHQLNDGATRLHASIGTGYKALTLYQLYSAFGTPALNPETSIGADAGIDQKFMDDRLLLSVTAYYNDFDDLIDFDPATFIYTNIAEARTYGVETALDFDVSEAWHIGAAYTYLYAEDKQTGRVLPRRPKHSFTLGSSYSWEQGANVGFDLRYLSRQLDSNYSPDYTASFTVVDLYGSYPLNKRWELYGRVDNLFDTDYEEVNNFNATGLAGYGGVRLRF